MAKHGRFFICEHCGNMVGMINDAGVPIVCCGEKMKELVPNTVDAAQEKHVPVVETKGDEIHVQIGSVIHPMVKEHFIQWIYLEMEKGGQRKAFAPGDEPKAEFKVVDDKPVAVYEYCNIHGLWKTEI